jgi:phosphoglucosamine mutase
VIARARHRGGMLRGSVVGTLMTNLGLEQALQAQGIGLVRTNVGDRYILERLRQEGWTLGGEPSGHIICLDRTTTGDGTVSALQVLAEMMRTGRSLRELRDGLVKFPQRLINVRLAGGSADAAMRTPLVQDAVRGVEAELGSGGRVLLRPSGTEPLLRVMVEGEEAGQVERLAGQIADAVRAAVG